LENQLNSPDGMMAFKIHHLNKNSAAFSGRLRFWRQTRYFVDGVGAMLRCKAGMHYFYRGALP